MSIKQEATIFLQSNKILEILSDYGKAEVVGSYMFDIMTWKDIDIVVTNNILDKSKIYSCGQKLLDQLNPKGMDFENRILDHKPYLPLGFYWGVVSETGWKMDIWFINEEESTKQKNFREDLFKNLNEESRKLIVELKSLPEYRKKFNSMDVYTKVLKDGVATKEEFLKQVEI